MDVSDWADILHATLVYASASSTSTGSRSAAPRGLLADLVPTLGRPDICPEIAPRPSALPPVPRALRKLRDAVMAQYHRAGGPDLGALGRQLADPAALLSIGLGTLVVAGLGYYVLFGVPFAAHIHADRPRRGSTALRRRRRDPATTLYPPGLVNVGNTCFLNSVLQALASLPSLVAHCRARTRAYHAAPACARFADSRVDEPVVTEALDGVLQYLNETSSRQTSRVPTEVLTLVLPAAGRLASFFQQQDAQELFQIISTRLTNESPALCDVDVRVSPFRYVLAERSSTISSGNSSTTSATSAAASAFPIIHSPHRHFHFAHQASHASDNSISSLRNPFTGLYVTQLVCLTCGRHGPLRHYMFDNLSLPLPENVSAATLPDLIHNYQRPETLDGVVCPFCTLNASTASSTRDLDPTLPVNISRVHVPMAKHVNLARLPDTLALHIQRSWFSPSGHSIKLSTRVLVPLLLVFSPTGTIVGAGDEDDKPDPFYAALGINNPRSLPNRFSRREEHQRTSSSSKHGVFPSFLWKDGEKVLDVVSQPPSEPPPPGLEMATPASSIVLPPRSSTDVASGPIGAQTHYALAAVIIHYGGHDSGHYVTLRSVRRRVLVRSDNDGEPARIDVATDWFRCSDASVDRVADIRAELEYEARNIFFCFYEKVRSNSRINDESAADRISSKGQDVVRPETKTEEALQPPLTPPSSQGDATQKMGGRNGNVTAKPHRRKNK